MTKMKNVSTTEVIALAMEENTQALMSINIDSIRKASTETGIKVSGRKKTDIIKNLIDGVKASNKSGEKEATPEQIEEVVKYWSEKTYAPKSVLQLPTGSLSEFGNTEHHEDIYLRHDELNRQFVEEKSHRNHILFLGSSLFEEGKGMGYKGEFVGYAEFQLKPGTLFYKIIRNVGVSSKKFEAEYYDASETGLNLCLNSKYNPFHKLGEKFRYGLRPGVIRVPLVLVDEGTNVAVKIKKSVSKDGQFYHNIFALNTFTESMDGNIAQAISQTMTQMVRVFYGTATIANEQNNVLRDGTKCVSLRRLYTVDEVDVQTNEDFDTGNNIYPRLDTTEATKVGSVLPSYVCGMTGEMLDLDAVHFVNEQRRSESQRVEVTKDFDSYNVDNETSVSVVEEIVQVDEDTTKTYKKVSYTHKTSQDQQQTKVVFVGPKEVLVGNEVMNQNEFIESEVKKKCVECPLFLECGRLGKSTIEKNTFDAVDRAKASGKQSKLFVKKNWYETEKPGKSLPKLHVGSQVLNCYPHEVGEIEESHVEDMVFELRGHHNFSVIAFDSTIVNFEQDATFVEAFNKDSHDVRQLMSMAYNTAFSFNKYSKEEATTRFDAVFKFAESLNTDSKDYQAKVEQINKALQTLANNYVNYMEKDEANYQISTVFLSKLDMQFIKLGENNAKFKVNPLLPASSNFNFVEVPMSQLLQEDYYEAVTMTKEDKELFFASDNLRGMFSEDFKEVLDYFMFAKAKNVSNVVITNDIGLTRKKFQKVVATANNILEREVNGMIYSMNKSGDGDYSNFNPALHEYFSKRLHNA